MEEFIPIESIEIPTEALKTVTDWIKSEQVRTIRGDRLFARNHSEKVDHLTDALKAIEWVRTIAVADNTEISSRNSWNKEQVKRKNAAEEARCKNATCHCNGGH